MRPPRILVAALGTDLRGDDGVGPAVARSLPPEVTRLAEVAIVADATDLLTSWDGADLVVVADAVASGDRPGSVRVFDLGGAFAPPSTGVTTHTLSLLDALRLSRVLGRGPRRLVVVGVEAAGFDPGAGLSGPVAAAVPAAAAEVADVIRRALPCA
ncbi:MAG TPA: hydrogenase maturation protease [Acidimicrobiales bacterium]|nr:hydrogenase maturation protease [Acidimicrobiales bacterium]